MVVVFASYNYPCRPAADDEHDGDDGDDDDADDADDDDDDNDDNEDDDDDDDHDADASSDDVRGTGRGYHSSEHLFPRELQALHLRLAETEGRLRLGRQALCPRDWRDDDRPLGTLNRDLARRARTRQI